MPANLHVTLAQHAAPTAVILDQFGQVQEGGTDGYAEVLKRLVNADDHTTLRELAQAFHRELQHVAAVSRQATDTNVFKTIAAHLEIPTAFETGSQRTQDFPEAWNGPNAPPADAVQDPQEAAMIQRRSLFRWLSWMTLPNAFNQLTLALMSPLPQGLDKALWIASVIRPGDHLAVLQSVLQNGNEAHFDTFVQRMQTATRDTWQFANEQIMPLYHLVQAGARGGLPAFQVAIRAVQDKQDVLWPTDQVTQHIMRWRDFAIAGASNGHADLVLFCYQRLLAHHNNYILPINLQEFWPIPLRLLTIHRHYDGVIAVVNGLGEHDLMGWTRKCAMISWAVQHLDSADEIRRLMEAAYTPVLDGSVDNRPAMAPTLIEDTLRRILDRAIHPALRPSLETFIGRGRAFLAGLSARHPLVQALPNGNRMLEVATNPSPLDAPMWCRTLTYTLAVLGNQVPMSFAWLTNAMRYVLGKALNKPFQEDVNAPTYQFQEDVNAPTDAAVIACFVTLRGLFESNRTASNPGRAAHHLANDLFRAFFYELTRLLRDGAIRRICPPDLMLRLVEGHLTGVTPSAHAPPVDNWQMAATFRQLIDGAHEVVRSKLNQRLDAESLRILREYDVAFHALNVILTQLDTTGISAESGHS
tara:strand:- start:282 stop:2207 length:1926 start_codon:yes stop_codon:yes gene_type:complete